MTGANKLSQLDPRIRDIVIYLFTLLDDVGVRGTVYDVYRSPAEQNRRFALGDTKARAGESPHQYGLAFDFVVSQGEQSAFQRELQGWWQQLGFTVIDWDPAHVEVPQWRQWIQ